MKARAKCLLLVASEADAVAVADDLATWLAANPAWRVDQAPRPVLLHADEWGVSCEAEYTTNAGAVSFLTRIESRWTSGPFRNVILAGSWVEWHECRHEDGTGFCTVDPANRAVK